MHRIKNIKDLAVLAGVSAGTVSRALAGSELISFKTRERIKALADEHSFRPNVLARNLRTQRTGAIGVVVPLRRAKGERISNPFFSAMLGLLADALTERGYDLLLSTALPSHDFWLEQYVGSGRVDGVLLIGQQDQPDAIDAVAAQYRPMVVWGGHREGQRACTVGTDNFKGGTLAASHLIERGCRHLAFVADIRPLEMAQRLAGVREAVAQAGGGVRLTVVSAKGQLRETLAAAERPDGIVAGSDAIATSILVKFGGEDLRVPEDIKVIGYDGLAIGNSVATRLTTIDQQIEVGARHMVDLLLRRIAGEDTGSVILEPTLLVREST